MYSTIYTYEVTSKSLLPDMTLSADYNGPAIFWAIIVGILSLAFIAAAAILIKKGRVFGIITAVLQPIGALAGAFSVINYAKIDFAKLNFTVTASTQDAAWEKFYERFSEIMFEEIFAGFVVYLACAAVYTLVLVLTLVYFIMLIKAKGGALAIGAMVLTIIRFLVVAPINMFALIPTKTLNALFGDVIAIFNVNHKPIMDVLQGGWDIFFGLALLLPALLVAVQGIINILSKNKKTAPVVEAPVENE